MTRRALVVFPQSDQLDVVERMRRRYDPQARLIAAHVTLVFPFDDRLSADELRDHVVHASRGVAPFAVRFAGIEARDDYVFWVIGDGAQQVRALHDRLYAGPLAAHRSRAHIYRPHVTLGRIADVGARAEAVDVMRSTIPEIDAEVTSISVFRLTDAGQGTIDATIPLAGS